MSRIVLFSFLAYTLAVFVFVYFKLQKSKQTSSEAFFLGGRSLKGTYIAGVMLLTNLSAVSFVGMSAQSYSGNMSVMGWEVTSGILLVIVALFLLPRYLRQGITTIPDFLESRYSSSVKKAVTLLFLLQYIVNVLPTTLYAGARVLIEVFDVQTMLGLTEFEAIFLVSSSIAFVGLFYALFGGLKAIATANTLNSVGLIIGGFLILFLGLTYLGEGKMLEGCRHMLMNSPQKLQSIGRQGDPLPFGTLFTGIMLVNLYYWGADQSILQGALGAKSLKEGQKGLLYIGYVKLLTPLFLIVPGIIAYHIFGPDAGNPDAMYTRLVNVVLPKPLVGLFVAVMFGAVLGVFSAVLNGAATLFTLNVYQPLVGCSEGDFVKEGRVGMVIITVISAAIAPFILYAPAGVFDFLQRVAGAFSVPILTIVLVGYLSKRTPSSAAILALLFFVLSYALMQLVFDVPLHFLHQLALLFVLTVVLMLLVRWVSPRDEIYVLPLSDKVDVQPWAQRGIVSAILIYFIFGVFLLFSNYGLLSADQLALKIYVFLGVLLLVVYFFRKKNRVK